MKQEQPQKAVIYCSVASTMVGIRDEAIILQEARCRRHADDRRYEVEMVFYNYPAEGVPAGRGMTEVLQFLAERAPEQYVVIVDDIRKLGRDMATYARNRTSIRETGARLESPSFGFADDAGSVLVENLLVSAGEYLDKQEQERMEAFRTMTGPRLKR